MGLEEKEDVVQLMDGYRKVQRIQQVLYDLQVVEDFHNEKRLTVEQGAFGLIDLSYDGEIPGRERGVGRRAGREHGEAALQILAWRDAFALVARLLAAAKPARDESFTHVLTSCSCVALLLLFTILLYADVQSSLLQS